MRGFAAGGDATRRVTIRPRPGGSKPNPHRLENRPKSRTEDAPSAVQADDRLESQQWATLRIIRRNAHRAPLAPRIRRGLHLQAWSEPIRSTIATIPTTTTNPTGREAVENAAAAGRARRSVGRVPLHGVVGDLLREPGVVHHHRAPWEAPQADSIDVARHPGTEALDAHALPQGDALPHEEAVALALAHLAGMEARAKVASTDEARLPGGAPLPTVALAALHAAAQDGSTAEARVVAKATRPLEEVAARRRLVGATRHHAARVARVARGTRPLEGVGTTGALRGARQGDRGTRQGVQ